MKIDLDRTITREDPFKIIFVCLGNICRSPTAEGIFQHLVNERGLQHYFYVESAGTSAYHIGERANKKSRQVASENGVELNSRARLFEPDDLDEFDMILAMDSDNQQNINKMDTGRRFGNKIYMMRDFDPNPGDGNVPDPYYGGLDGFQNVYDVVYRSCEALLDELEVKIEA